MRSEEDEIELSIMYYASAKRRILSTVNILQSIVYRDLIIIMLPEVVKLRFKIRVAKCHEQYLAGDH